MSPVVDHLDPVCLENRDVNVFSARTTMVLQHQQTRRGDLEHQARWRHKPCRTPDAQSAVDVPDAEVDAASLDGWCDAYQADRFQWKRRVEDQWLGGLRRRHQRQ